MSRVTFPNGPGRNNNLGKRERPDRNFLGEKKRKKKKERRRGRDQEKNFLEKRRKKDPVAAA